jgi:tellurium resistance protein TerD
VNTTGGKNEEELRFDLTEDYSGSTGIHVVDIYRRNGEWKMKAVGEGAKKDLGGYLAQFKG